MTTIFQISSTVHEFISMTRAVIGTQRFTLQYRFIKTGYSFTFAVITLISRPS